MPQLIERRGPAPTRYVDEVSYCAVTRLPTTMCDCYDRGTDEPLQPVIDGIVHRFGLVFDQLDGVWRHPSGQVPTITPAGQPIQPDHQHPIRPEWVDLGDVWLPITEAQRFAPTCAGCAWQVHVHDYVAKYGN